MTQFITGKLDEIDRKLRETEEAAGFSKGPVQDALAILVPALRDISGVVRDLSDEVDRKAPM